MQQKSVWKENTSSQECAVQVCFNSHGSPVTMFWNQKQNRRRIESYITNNGKHRLMPLDFTTTRIHHRVQQVNTGRLKTNEVTLENSWHVIPQHPNKCRQSCMAGTKKESNTHIFADVFGDIHFVHEREHVCLVIRMGDWGQGGQSLNTGNVKIKIYEHIYHAILWV